MWVQRIRHGLRWRVDLLQQRVRPIWRGLTDQLFRFVVGWRWCMRWRGQKHHRLPASLIVSLTSFPARYDVLSLTLKSLLSQSVRPDRLILWIAAEHRQALPRSVLNLVAHGLTIEFCDNTLRSHNKYLHVRRQYPTAFIATADDDTYYRPDWLAELIANVDLQRRVIPCHRAHKITLQADGELARYREWQWETADAKVSALIFPTGVGGVLYPPGSLHPDVDNVDRILALCPRADDVWLYWMALRNGYLFRKIGRWRRLHHWRDSQQQGLMWENVYNSNGNDEQIKAMIGAYGWPPTPVSLDSGMAANGIQGP